MDSAWLVMSLSDDEGGTKGMLVLPRHLSVVEADDMVVVSMLASGIPICPLCAGESPSVSKGETGATCLGQCLSEVGSTDEEACRFILILSVSNEHADGNIPSLGYSFHCCATVFIWV